MLRAAILLLVPWVAQAGTLIIRHVNLVDLGLAMVLPDRCVRIDDGRITRVGKSTLLPRGATVVDARGKFMMPGLVGTLNRAPHELVASGVTAIRFRGSM